MLRVPKSTPTSPPPASSSYPMPTFTSSGLSNSKIPAQNPMPHLAGMEEEKYIAIPSDEHGDIPPMPEVPKKVRLPSGEIVDTRIGVGRETRPENGKEGGEFVWDRDVF